MLERTSNFLDSARLLFGLQQGNRIAQSLSGCLEPEVIASRVTEGLVEKFNCAFARIWIVEPDRTALKLVASSGMYTRLDGSFAQVPMGAFKVGKIAQHCIPFLSNHLAEETWVKDRNWAIKYKIQGFAGYPLVTAAGAIAVLAVFSRQAMEPEFLEILQGLCTTVTVALDSALRYQREKQVWQSAPKTLAPSSTCTPLSEQLAHLLQNSRLALLGTERPLTASLTCLFLRSGEILSQMQCIHSRLTYGAEQISLEAMVAIANQSPDELAAAFGELPLAVSCLGGTLETYTGVDQTALQITLAIPYPSCSLGLRLRIQCQSPVLQMAFTQLAYSAGLTVDLSDNPAVPLVTDHRMPAQTASAVLWVSPAGQSPPKNVKAKLDLSINAGQLREAIAAVMRGELWGMEAPVAQSLSEREQEILALLVQGLRDRDIATQLVISESTVKFHMNNILAKLKVRTRYQAIYQAIVNGWLV